MRTEAAMLGVFETEEALESAVSTLQTWGYPRLEVYSPHPLPELETKLGIARSRTPRVVFAGGVVGAAFAFFLQSWLNAVDYPINVGGRPLFSAPAFIPITFETTVLFASLTAFIAWLVVSRLPTLDDPVLEVEGFSACIDRFWLAVAAGTPAFDVQRCASHLREAGAVRIVFLPEVER
jgi:hypothetical protein